MSPTDISTIVSLLPINVDEVKPGLIPSQFRIPAVVDPMNDIAVLVISRARFPVYLDEDRPALIVPAPSDTVAESLCRDYKVSMAQYEPGVAEPGLFWLSGDYTVAKVKKEKELELMTARSLQIEWFKRLVAQADDDWSRNRIRRMISSVQRLACNALKLTRDWNMEREVNANLAMTQCKFCRADVHPEALVCTHCRGILNMDRYKKEFAEAGTVR